MKKLALVAAAMAAVLTLASCNDPNNPGPQPDEDCELERKKISMIEPNAMVHQAKFSSRSSGFRSSSRSSWSSRSKPSTSTYRSKPTPKVPYSAPSGYRWVWDCD